VLGLPLSLVTNRPSHLYLHYYIRSSFSFLTIWINKKNKNIPINQLPERENVEYVST